MAYTTDRTWVTGEVVTAALMNTYVRDNIKWLSTDKPMVRAYRTTAQSIANSSYDGIQMDTEIFDNANIHGVTNTDRFTVPSGAGGKWLCGASVQWVWSTIGVYRIAAVTVDGAAEFQTSSPTVGTSSETPTTVSGIVTVNAAQVIRPAAFQDSGGALNTSTGFTKNVGGWAMWVGV